MVGKTEISVFQTIIDIKPAYSRLFWWLTVQLFRFYKEHVTILLQKNILQNRPLYVIHSISIQFFLKILKRILNLKQMIYIFILIQILIGLSESINR